MLKGLVLPVDVGDEVLGALGQVQNGLEVDDLRAGSLDGGILAGQHFQVVQVFRAAGLGGLHAGTSFYVCKRYMQTGDFKNHYRTFCRHLQEKDDICGQVCYNIHTPNKEREGWI